MTQKVGAVVKAVLRDKDDTAIVLVLKDGNTTSLKDGDNVYVELTNVTTGDKVNFYQAPAPHVEEDLDLDVEDEELPIELKPVEEVKIPEPPADVVAEEPKKPEPSDVDLFPDTAPAPTPEG